MRRSKDDAEQTRIAILDAAERVFCEMGIAAATLERISRAAGVTRGAFYWHFKDKGHLLGALHDRCKPPQKAIIEAAAEHGHDDPLGLLEGAAIEMLKLFETDENRQRLFSIMSGGLRACDTDGWLDEANANMAGVLTRLSAQAAADGSLHPDFSPQEAGVMMMATMNGLLTEWLRSGKAFPLSGLGTKILRCQTGTLRRGLPREEASCPDRPAPTPDTAPKGAAATSFVPPSAAAAEIE